MLNIDLQQSRFFPEVTAIGDVRDQDYLDKKLEGAECVVLLAAQHRDMLFRYLFIMIQM